jgi:hypothetical protein
MTLLKERHLGWQAIRPALQAAWMRALAMSLCA